MPLSTKRRLHIAFACIEGTRWTAGVNYLRNLFLALRSLDYDCRPQIALLVSRQIQPESYTSLSPYVDELLDKPPRPGFWQRQIARLQQRVGIEPRSLLASCLREQQVDCLFALDEFGARLGVPLLSWIPDFQHLHLPEMVSAKEIGDRHRRFSCIARRADRVILSSQDALGDFERFAPQAAHKARVLHFVAQVSADIYDADPVWVCDHYHLPERFVFLPNQFWKHKNHDIVIQALALVKTEHREITVVCTGNTMDHRDPLYFGRLLATISTLGLRDHLILLGFVPHAHIFQLMRQSLAVLQPSLFEGWSTTVEEAKSVGKRVILSDIPVHREQDPPQAIFFDPRDREGLADGLLRVFGEGQPGPDVELEALARERLPLRTREFAQSFVEIVREVVLASKR